MLVSVDELRLYMGGYQPAPGLEKEMINILNGVQGELELYLNRPVELVQVREAAYSDSKGNLYLSVTPVRKIISCGVNVDSQTIPDLVIEPYDIEADPSLEVDGRIIDKIDRRIALPNPSTWGITVPYYNSRYFVEYIGGIDGRKEESIKNLIKRVAAREYASNHVDAAGLRRGDVDRTEVGDDRRPGWSFIELDKLQRFRRRTFL